MRVILRQWRPTFKVGDEVTWNKLGDPDVPPGTVGKVIRHEDDGRAEVKFPKGTWCFNEQHLSKDAERVVLCRS